MKRIESLFYSKFSSLQLFKFLISEKFAIEHTQETMKKVLAIRKKLDNGTKDYYETNKDLEQLRDIYNSAFTRYSSIKREIAKRNFDFSDSNF